MDKIDFIMGSIIVFVLVTIVVPLGIYMAMYVNDFYIKPQPCSYYYVHYTVENLPAKCVLELEDD